MGAKYVKPMAEPPPPVPVKGSKKMAPKLTKQPEMFESGPLKGLTMKTVKAIGAVVKIALTMNLVILRSKMLLVAQSNRFAKTSAIYFLTIEDIRIVFPGLSDTQIYHLYKVFDLSKKPILEEGAEEKIVGAAVIPDVISERNIHEIRIGSLDFWGGLALLATDGIDEKVNFCFRLMIAIEDYSTGIIDENPYLSFNDIIVLMICVTRGVAKLKGFINIPPEVSHTPIHPYTHTMRRMALQLLHGSFEHHSEDRVLLTSGIRSKEI